jgi:hypothetical protein
VSEAKKNFYIIKECRICGTSDFKTIIELGEHPLANSLKSNLNQIEEKFPLTLVFCPACSLVQIKETVFKEILFKSYVWVTGTSKTTRNFSEEFFKSVQKHVKTKDIFAVEVASNDGTFLKPFKNAGHRVLGVDPAQNIAQIANNNGIPTISDFFGINIGKSIISKYGKANIVFARNVVPHSADLHEVIGGIECCLRDDGVGAIEFHYAQAILDESQYDSIYHEHLSYFSLHSICFLLEMHNLNPFDILESPISGGALVIYFSKEKRKISNTLNEKKTYENNTGILRLEEWNKFAKNCVAHKEKLVLLLKKENKNRIIGYGASARSSTLINFCGLNNFNFECISDANTFKHGKFAPGTNIPIVSPDIALSKVPDVILLLAWNFKDEILSILKGKYNYHGKVILPLPYAPQVIEV